MKRMALSEFESVRVSGLIAINLDEGDELGWARLTSGNDELIMVTAGGMALRVKEDVIRPMGRTAKGITGINLHEGDRLASLEVVVKDAFLFVVTEKGYGKCTPLTQYRTQGRAGKGIATIHLESLKTIGKIASARVVEKGDQLTLISNNGIMLRIDVDAIKKAGRATRGVRIMNMGKTDSVATVGRISDSKREL